jgi:hypothetical protein
MAFKNIDGELPIDMVYDTSHLKRAVTTNKFYQNTKIYQKLSQLAICRDLYSFDMPYHIKNPNNNLHCHGKKMDAKLTTLIYGKLLLLCM